MLDNWAALSFKAPFAVPGSGPYSAGVLSWMSDYDRRRLMAYTMLRAYQDNVARTFLGLDGADGNDAAAERREFGDPALVVKQTMAALLGQSQQIVVDGADDWQEQLPEDATPDDAALNDEAQVFADRQEWLREWADAERLPVRLLECERNAVGLGDGVYVLAWDPGKGRPTVQVVNPGFYFPVLPEGLSDAYPTRVHLAWELPPAVDGGPRRLRRTTYELAPIVGVQDLTVTPGGAFARLLRLTDTGAAVPAPGDTLSADGTITRRYPWQDPADQPSAVTCYLTEAEWDLPDANGTTATPEVDLLAPEGARYLTNAAGQTLDRLDLQIDFVPVVHIPNTPAGGEHYGRSSLSDVLQLLDEISSTDTDESAASGTTGTPPIALSGTQAPRDSRGGIAEMTVGPGEVWYLGENGSMSTVDTSPALTALAARGDRLLERLSVNARLPASVLGRQTAGGGQESGLHLLLTFGPLTAMVRELRLARGEKYPLLLKFVQRLAMAGAGSPRPDGLGLAPGVIPRAELTFGSYLPTDEEGAITRIRGLHTDGLISAETALIMLQAAGVPIGDVQGELERIRAQQFAQAVLLADATNDQAAVRDYLGLAPAPAVQLPPAGALAPGAFAAAAAQAQQMMPAGQPPGPVSATPNDQGQTPA